MKKRSILAVGIAAVAIAPATALAQNNTGPNAQGAGGVPPADEPLVRTDRFNFKDPTISIDGGAGVMGFVGGAAGIGPAWNARLSALVAPKIALEANYLGAANSRPNTDDALLMTSLDASVRYNFLRMEEASVVQPFVTGGLGWAGYAGSGGDGFTLIVPVSGGVERMLTRNIKIGGRLAFRPAFLDNLGTDAAEPNDEPGADTYAIIGHVGGGF